MKYNNYKEFEKEYSKFYTEKKYSEVLGLLDKSNEVLSEEEYGKNLFTILLDKARVYSEVKDSKGCLSVITDGLGKGFSFPLHWERFVFLENEESFDEIKKKNELLLQNDREAAQFKYEVHLPKSYDENKKYPLFFILHGDGADGNIEDIKWYWKPNVFLELGFIVVYPQATQVYCHNGYGWLKDPLLARKQIEDCYEEIKNEYSINESCVILSGFSGGANAVVDFLMTDVIPTNGFIGLCPGETVKSFEKSVAEKAAIRGAKGVIMEGEYETEAPVQDMLKEFEEVGFPCEYFLNKGVGHWYPNDLDQKVSEAIKFILE